MYSEHSRDVDSTSEGELCIPLSCPADASSDLHPSVNSSLFIPLAKYSLLEHKKTQVTLFLIPHFLSFVWLWKLNRHHNLVRMRTISESSSISLTFLFVFLILAWYINRCLRYSQNEIKCVYLLRQLNLCLLNLFFHSLPRTRNPNRTAMVALGVSNLCFMLPWQFAQFVLLTQVNKSESMGQEH